MIVELHYHISNLALMNCIIQKSFLRDEFLVFAVWTSPVAVVGQSYEWTWLRPPSGGLQCSLVIHEIACTIQVGDSLCVCFLLFPGPAHLCCVVPRTLVLHEKDRWCWISGHGPDCSGKVERAFRRLTTHVCVSSGLPKINYFHRPDQLPEPSHNSISFLYRRIRHGP